MRFLFYYLPSLLSVMLCLAGCQGRRPSYNASSEAADSEAFMADTVSVCYAEGFTLQYQTDGTILLDIRDPQGRSRTAYQFLLLPPGTEEPAKSDRTPLRIPVSRVICMTSLQLSNFIRLGALDVVSGITSSRHLFNPELKERLADGRIVRIGFEGEFDSEVIMAASPDVVLISPFKRGGYDALRESCVPLVPHLGYKELTPLGQAEWIKLVGLLTGRTHEANEAFDSIQAHYDYLCSLTKGITSPRPTVLSGDMKGGSWYAQGGRSFLARLIEDAGADYFLASDTTSGGVTLDFETVYARAESLDYWRINNSYKGRFTYDALRQMDERYADFRAFRQHQVIYCNMSTTPFYESMPVEPDAVLADFIHIFHPELLPDHTPKYYSTLSQ